MKITKSMLAAGAVTTVALASLAGLGTVSAQSNNSDSIVDKISTKFGLNTEDVQAVFDEQRTEMHKEHEQKQAERLQTLVDNGTITAEQKMALEAKHEEMEATREALKDQDLTREEIHTQMEATRNEFKAWAESQGIDLSAIRPEGGRGHGGRMHMGMDNDSDTN